MKADRKKRLKLRRKRKKRMLFNPRIVVDTNVLYMLADNDELFEKVKFKIAPNYINLWELNHTGKLYKNTEAVRGACKILQISKRNLIMDQPLKYLIRSGNKRKFKYNTYEDIYPMIKFVDLISKGNKMPETAERKFVELIKQKKQGLVDIANWINGLAIEIKPKIKNIEKHRKKNSMYSNYIFLDYLIRKSTNNKFNIKRIPLKNYQLLLSVMGVFEKEIETKGRAWKRNDLFDLFLLAYVRKGDKIWTLDDKWNKFIIKAGFESYIYKPISGMN